MLQVCRERYTISLTKHVHASLICRYFPIQEMHTDAKGENQPLAYHQISMSGNPWGYQAGENDAVHGRLTVLRLIEKMAAQGWKLVCIPIKHVIHHTNLTSDNQLY